MREIKNFKVEYDYFLALIVVSGAETLIGGAEKIVKKALKDTKNPNLESKSLDVYYRGKPLGKFAVDVNQNAPRVEIITELVDILYTNLLNPNSNSKRISEIKIRLETIFRTDSSYAIKLLVRTVLTWYDAVTDVYMNGRKSGIMRVGLPLSPKDRAALGEQFKADVNVFIEDAFTTLKRKNPPRDTEDNENVIERSTTEISEFLAEYSCYLSTRKTFCIYCKDCERYFIAGAWNARLCPDCKVLHNKASKSIFRSNCSQGIRQERQRLKYGFENYIHKSKFWSTLTAEQQAEYKAWHREFTEKSAELLRQLDNGEDVEEELKRYLKAVESKKLKFENNVKFKEFTERSALIVNVRSSHS